jgi:hypothetical protein
LAKAVFKEVKLFLSNLVEVGVITVLYFGLFNADDNKQTSIHVVEER